MASDVVNTGLKTTWTGTISWPFRACVMVWECSATWLRIRAASASVIGIGLLSVSGLDALPSFKEDSPGTRVYMFTNQPEFRDKALRAGLLILPAILLGTITAVGGGMMKDSLAGDVPKLLKPGTLYGLAAVAAATLFVLLAEWPHTGKGTAGVAAVVLAAGIRGLAVKLKWETRPAADLSPWLFGVAQRVKHRVRPRKTVE